MTLYVIIIYHLHIIPKAIFVLSPSVMSRPPGPPRQVDVDVIMSDGEWQFAAVSDNGPTSGRHGLSADWSETWIMLVFFQIIVCKHICQHHAVVQSDSG